MSHRNIHLTGTQAGLGYFSLSGLIAENSGELSGTLSLVADDLSVNSVAVTGTATGSPETLPVTSLDTATLNAGGSINITLDGTAAMSLTGTAPDGLTAISTVLNGSVGQHPVQYETPAIGYGNPFEVIDGITVDDPCSLAKALNAARIQLIAGQSVSRTEFDGRELQFHKGDLEALTAEIKKQEALCAASSGNTVTTPDLTHRSRRQIRINPYS